MTSLLCPPLLLQVKTKFEGLEGSSGKVNETVVTLTNDLAEVTDRLEELKENFDSRDSGMHDTSPLVRIKAALQQLKVGAVREGGE